MRFGSLLVFVAITSCSFTHLLAQSTGPDAELQIQIPLDPHVRTGELSNGLHYYIRKNEKPENRAELRLAVKAGSIQEDADQLGLAHFVEHMAFNGTEHFTKNELIDYLESVGTRFGPDLNAYTSFDETVYMLQVRTDDQEQFDKGLTVLEDWAGGLLFDEEEIDKERGVVVSEWRTRLSANQRMQQKYFPVMFHKSRYAERLPIGDPEIVGKADYATIRRFYEDWYRPDLMAVVVTGDVDVDSIEHVIIDRFASLENPGNPRARKEYPVPPHEETLVVVCSDREASFTNVRIMYKHPEQEVRDLGDYRQNLKRRLYNRMLNARLYELNSTADPPFVFASSGYGGSVGNIDTYYSFAMVPEGGVIRGFEALLAENFRVLRHGFVGSELERQKEEMLRSAEQRVKEKDRLESGDLARRYISHFLDQSPVPGAEKTLELYERFLPGITVDEVNALAEKWLTDENCVIILTGPGKEESPLPGEEELLNVLADVKTWDIAPYADEVVEAEFLEEEFEPVAVTRETVLDSALDIHMFELENGVRVMYKHTDLKNDEILMGAYSLGGHSLYDNEEYYSARAIGSVMRESGLSDLTAPQLEKIMAGTRVNVGPFVSERYEGFNGNCSVEDFELMFQLIHAYAVDPRFHEDGLHAYLKKQQAIYANLLSNPRNYFGDEVSRLRYNNHPRRAFPKPEHLEYVELEVVEDIYEDRFADMSDFTFFFTGNFDPDTLKSYSAQYLGNLPSTHREETWKDVGIDYPEENTDTTFYRGEAPKSIAQIIYHGPFDWNKENVFNLRALIDYLRIQLRETLREDMGGVYGVSVYGGPGKEPPRYSISISFNADPPRTQELMGAAYDVLNKAMNGEISEEDLQKVKETQRQTRVKNMEENRYWHSGMIDYWHGESDLQDLTLETLNEKLDALSGKDLQEMANTCFNQGARIEAVLHPGKFNRS